MRILFQTSIGIHMVASQRVELSLFINPLIKVTKRDLELLVVSVQKMQDQ